MNDVHIHVRGGDNIEDIAKTAMKIIKIKSVDSVVFSFNDIGIVVKKKNTYVSVINDYYKRMPNNS